MVNLILRCFNYVFAAFTIIPRALLLYPRLHLASYTLDGHRFAFLSCRGVGSNTRAEYALE
jgi:hypothetical protein